MIGNSVLVNNLDGTSHLPKQTNSILNLEQIGLTIMPEWSC